MQGFIRVLSVFYSANSAFKSFRGLNAQATGRNGMKP
jgi:hypothetical protein